MKKLFKGVNLLIILGVVVIMLFGCNNRNLKLTSLGSGFGLEYDSSHDYPVVMIKNEAELLLFSNEYRKYMDFNSETLNDKSIDNKFKEYNADFFKNNFLAVQLPKSGVNPGNYNATYEIIDGVLNASVKSKKTNETDCSIYLVLLVLEIPKNVECNSVTFTLQ